MYSNVVFSNMRKWILVTCVLLGSYPYLRARPLGGFCFFAVRKFTITLLVC